MAVPKRKAEFLGLRERDFLPISQDVAADYFNVYECPEILTQGKSSFLIGGSNFLKPNIDIKIELVNQNSDEVIYTQPVMGHSEGGLRRVSIEVYDDTTPGLYTLYIVGELNPDEVNVPQEWQGIYNVKWSKSITVNAMGTNTQPILFYKQPSINVSELFTNFVEIPSGSVTNIYLTGSGEPRQGLTPIAPVENMTEGGAGVASYPALDFANKAKLSIIEENKPLVKLSGKHGLIGSQGQQVQTMSPVPSDYLISLSGNSNVDSLYVGQDFTLNNPQVDTSKFTLESYHSVPTAYTSSVMKVLNKTTFVPKDVFYVYDTRTDPITLVPAPFASTYPISASYLPLPTQTPSTINKLSFADIQVKDLKTFSGDVHKLKIYAKSEGSLGDFELIYNSPVESFQVLHDKTAQTLLTNMGYFLDTTRLNNYWELYQGKDGNTSGTLTYDATYVNDAMKISGSNKEHGDSIRVQNKTAVDFIKGNLYSFRAKVYGIKKDKKDIDGNTSLNASFKVMAYGDAFNKEETTGAHWGDEKLSIPDMPDAVNEYDFGVVEGSFLADSTGTGYLQIKVDSGEWYVSDISLKAATDTAFNPDYVNLKAPVPPLLQRPDRIRFLVEFYDVNNNIADSVIFSEPFTFTGPNINIGGTDNILSGSMFIGNALAAGIEMAGVSSAYVRSMGYLGFSSGSGGGNNPDGVNSGFLMWSGSVLTDSGDDYRGVGLELVGHSGSYLKFRTDPSELDIRADAFFVGNPTSQFISGSGNNIEISSSNFHVQPDGDVIMTGTITAEAGNIGDWKIIDGKLSGSNATLDAVGAALYHTALGPGTDTSATFDQLRNEYYIDFTPSEGPTATAGKYYVKFGPNFSVSESGVLFASGAVFEGTITASAGLIGGWSIEDTYIGSVPDGLRLYGNSSDSSYHISSSDFQVTTTGQISASAGLIGGWTITDGYISKALSGSAAYQDYTRVYLSATTDTDKNIAEGLHVYRKDEDIEDGEVKVVRVGGLSDTTNLHANNDYGIQVIQKDSNSNYSNVMYIGESTQTISGFSINPIAIHSSDKSLILSGSGEITGSQVLFTGGKIGGWDISTTRIQSPGNTMRFTSTNPKITMGTHTFEDGPGIQLGFNSGKVEFYAGDGDIESAGTNYLKFHEDDGVDIKTAVFDLATPTMVVDSGVNSGKISLGSTPNTSVAGTNTGFYVDGTGDFLVRGDANNYMKMYGTGLQIKTEEFELDAGNIEISSTNASMSLGEGNIKLLGASNTIVVGATTNKQVNIVGSAGQGYIATAKSSVTDTTAGFWLANNNTDPEFNVGNATNFIRFNGGDLDIQSQRLEISSSTIQISSTNASMSLGHSSAYPRGRIILEGAGTPTFTAGTDASWINMSTGSGVYIDGDGNFKFGDDDGNVAFQNGSFSITGSDVAINVTDINISANGFQLSSNQASMSLGTNEQWKAYGGSVNPYMSIGMGGSGSYGGDGLWLAYNDTLGKPRVSFVGSTGHFKFTGTDLDIKTGTLALAASNIQLSSAQASMSLGGVPGAAANILLDGANSKIEVGSANKVTIQGGTTDNYMVMGSKSSFTHFDQSTQGIIIGMDSTVPKFEFAGSATNYISYDGSNFDIKLSQGLELAATNIQLSSTHASMSLGGVPGALSNITLDGVNSKIQVGATGSNSVTIQGGTFDNYMVMGSKSSFTHFDQSTAGIIIGMDSTVPKFEMVGSATNYISYDGSNFDIKLSQGLELDASNIEISSTHASMSLGSANDIILDGANNKITIGSGNSITIQGGAADNYMVMGSKSSFTHFDKSTVGIIIGMDSTVPKLEMVGSATNYLSFDGSNFDIKLSQGLELDASNIEISSTHASMSLGSANDINLDGVNKKITIGSANAVTIQGGGTDNYMVMGAKSSFSDEGSGTAGIIIGMDATNPQAEFVKSSTNYFIFDGSSGVDIKTTNFELAANTTDLQISSTQKSMSLGDGKVILQGASAPYMVLNSGSNAITLKTDGTDAFMTMGSKTSFSHEGSGTAGILIGMDTGNPQAEFVKDSGNYFIFDGTAGVDIKTTNFELAANTTDLQLSSTQKSMSLGDNKILLQGAATPYIKVGTDNPITLKTDGTDSYMVMGSKTSFTHYDKSTAGIIIGMDTGVPKIEMAKNSSDYLRWDSTDGLDLQTTKMEVSASNVQISSTHASMSIGDPASTGGAIVLHADGTDKMLKFGGKTTFDQDSTAGLIMGMDAGNPEFDYTVGTGNDQYIRMLTTGISMKVPTFQLDTDRLDIDSATSRIDVYDASDGLRVRIGEVDPTAGSHYGMVIYDGSGTTGEDELVHFSDAKNQIASWSLSNTQISSENLILDSAGIIQTSDFASGVKGWRITSANSGEAEFEKVTVRGTLATTVFEKETVNAVGGQLYVANSTIYTGSAQIVSTAETMSVANVGGFTSGEIISAKKISATGFATEYMYVESASRNIPSSETDLSGDLYLIRGYGLGLTGESGSLGGTPGISQSYESGQVIVSTGKVGTGFIRLNANPNDTTTPYMDVVERTGSGIYDIELKARLGDLSGLSSGLLYGETNPGFGLFTENVFLSGGITAVTGSITGKLHVRTDALNQVIIGTNVKGTQDGIYINNNNYWFTDAEWRVGDTNNFIFLSGSGGSLANDLSIQLEKFELNAGGGDLKISSTQKSMSFGDGDIIFQSYDATNSWGRIGASSTKAIYITGSSTVGAIRSGKTSVTDTTAGFWLANNNTYQEFNVGDATDFIRFSASAVNIETREFELDANTGDLQLSSTHKSMSLGDGRILMQGQSSPYIQIGNSANYSIKLQTDGTDQFMTMGSKTSFTHEGSGTGGILIGMDDDNPQAEFVSDDLQTYFIFDGDSGVDIKTVAFELAANTDDLQISSTQKSMSLGGNKLLLQGATAPYMVLNSGSEGVTLKSDGTDSYMVMGSKKSFSQEGSGTGGILIGMDDDNPQAEFVSDDLQTYFIFDGDSGIDIKTVAFELAAATDDLQISSTQKSMSLASGKILLEGGGNYGYARIGSSTTYDDNINISGSATQAIIKAGKTSFSDTAAGFVLEKTNSDARFYIGDVSDGSFIKFDTSDGLQIKSQEFELAAGTDDLQLSSTKASMSLAGGKILLDGGGNFGYIRVGGSTSLAGAVHISGSGNTGVIRAGKSAYTDTTQAGWILEKTATDSKFYVGDSSDGSFIKFDSDTGIDIASQKFELAAGTDDLQLSSTKASMSLAGGKILLEGGGNYGYARIGSSGTYDNNINISGSATQAIIKAGKTSYSDTVNAGFVLEKTATDAKFYVGDSNDGSFIKFDSDDGLEIGTQKFELAAGTSDLQISSTEASMSLAGGTILLDGGQTSGYIRVGSNATTRDNIQISGSATLAVIKAGITGSYADAVSAGDNGFILERNLTSTKFHIGNATEYIRFDGSDIDISADALTITASNVNITAGDGMEVDAPDFEISTLHKSMSLGYTTNTAYGVTMVGASDSYISFGPKTSPNFQLYSAGATENYLKIGSQTFGGTQGGVILGEASSGVYGLDMYKDGDEFFRFSTGPGGLEIRTLSMSLVSPGLTIHGVETAGASNYIKMGSATDVDAGEGFWADGGGSFRVGDATSGGTNFMKFSSGGSLQIVSDNIDITSTAFELVANTDDLQISSTHKSMSLASQKIVLEGSSTNGSLKIGGVSDVTDTTGANKGFYAEGDGDFIAKAGANKYIQFNGGDLDVKTDKLQIDASNFEVSSTQASMSLGEGKIKLVGASTSYITVGTANGITLSDDGTDRFMVMGAKSSFTHFDQSTGGIILGTDNNTPKFEMAKDANNYFSFNGTHFDVKLSQGFELDASNIELSSTNASMSLGEGKIKLVGASTSYITVGAASAITLKDDGTDRYLVVGDKTSFTHFDQSTDGIILGTDGGTAKFEIAADGDNYLSFNGSGLSISAETFDLQAGNTMLMNSSANSGTIRLGGSLGPSSVTADTQGIYMDGTGDFQVWGDADNYLRFDLPNLQMASETFDLKTTYLRVSSSKGGTIAMGETIPTSISGSGIFLSGSGDFLAGSHSGNKIQYSAGQGAILMQSNTFALDASTIIIDSSVNSGKIALGATPPTSVAYTSNAGVYMDGTGDFLAYGDSDNFIKKDGTALTLKAETFTLDATTLYLDNTTPSLRFAANASAFDYQDNSGIFIGKDGSYYVMSLKGSSGDSLNWDGNGNLDITGDITVTGGQMTGSISDFPSDENLFAYFPLHNEVISDAGNNRVLDMSGNGRHGDDDVGSISGGTTFVSGSTSGPTAGAAQFDGSDSRIDLNQVALDLTANMDLSLSFWIKKTNTNANIAPFGIHDGGVNDLIWIMDDGGVNNRTELYINEVTLGTLTVPTTYEFTNNWRHFVIVAEDGAQAKLYVDGEYIGNYTSANVETANFGDCDEMLLGGELDAAGGAPTNDFTGYISEFRVYNTVLTADNARALFNQPSGPLSGGTKITGDYISTGKLTSTNYSATAGSQIDLDAGTAVFGGSDGTGITFEAGGDITSKEYLVERSRLFGAGEDGDLTISSGTTTLTADMYYADLTVASGATLRTGGYRLFVNGTLTNAGTISNGGGAASGRTTTGTGGAGGTLADGQAGSQGGLGGASGGSGGSAGGDGGASGGTGGHILIMARYVVNSGTIKSNGGAGAVGANAGSPAP